MRRYCYEAKHHAVDSDTTDYGGGRDHLCYSCSLTHNLQVLSFFWINNLENFKPQMDRKA